MGGFAPGPHISKGPLCYCLDKVSRRSDAVKRLGKLRKDLQGLKNAGYQGSAEVFRKHLFDVCKIGDTNSVVKYLKMYWFNEYGGWWPHLQPIEPAFCIGIIKTLKVAIDKKLPIESYWLIVKAGFEMTIAQSPYQVTLLIMTPEPADPRASGVWTPKQANIWLVKDCLLGGERVGDDEWERKAPKKGKKKTSAKGRVVSIHLKRAEGKY